MLPLPRRQAELLPRLVVLGVHRPGGFAEYVVAPERNVHRAPRGFSLPFASSAEPVGIGVQACRRGEVAAGKLVLVVGADPIGPAVMQMARARGARGGDGRAFSTAGDGRAASGEAGECGGGGTGKGGTG